MNDGGATISTIDQVIILGFLVLVTVVGYVMSRAASKGVGDYFLGGNKIPWWVLGISTSTSNFDMAGTMMIVAVVFALGLKGFLVEIRGGVGLSLAFLMIFLAKWLRRSRVMTSAEWMKLRFGTDLQGRAAHLLSAIANIVLSLGLIIYFCKGAGSFLTYFLPYSELTCTTVMVIVGLFYTLMSGLYGVVFTDVIQMIILSFTAVYISVMAFGLAPQVELPADFLSLSLENPTGPGAAQLLADKPDNWGPIFNFFGLCVLLWFFRTMLEGCGGVGGYTDQRFFAARSEREASLLTLEAIVLSLMRWTMVAGLVVMGLHILQTGAPGSDVINKNVEKVLPVVLGRMLPMGVLGVVIAGLVAAAMSTFDSTLNAGASYIVRDVYQTYVNPKATGKQLMTASRVATTALCVAGVSLAAVVPNINTIWQFITMGLGAGLFVPLFLRWYWPRFNGWGFAGGTAAGIVAGIVVQGALQLPLYVSFPTIVGVALAASVIVSLVTPKTSNSVLVQFYLQINPWGLWGRISDLAKEQGKLDDEGAGKRLWEKINDVIALCLAVPFQLTLLVAGMAFILHDWSKFAGMAIIATICGTGLYFFWYRNLKSEQQCKKEDAYYKMSSDTLETAETTEAGAK